MLFLEHSDISGTYQTTQMLLNMIGRKQCIANHSEKPFARNEATAIPHLLETWNTSQKHTLSFTACQKEELRNGR